jgi:hypothetical protein
MVIGQYPTMRFSSMGKGCNEQTLLATEGAQWQGLTVSVLEIVVVVLLFLSL